MPSSICDVDTGKREKDMPENPQTPSRRRLLAAGAMGLAAGTGPAVFVSLPGAAEAAAGDPLLVGRTNNAGTESGPTTLVTNSSKGHGLHVLQKGSQYALFGQAQESYGAIGRTESERSYGVMGINAATVSGAGAGVRAVGNQQHGLVSATAAAGRWAVIAVNQGAQEPADQSTGGGVWAVGGPYGPGVQAEGADGVIGSATAPLGFGLVGHAPADSAEGAALYAHGPSILQGFTAVDKGLDTLGPVTYLENAFLIPHPAAPDRYLQHAGVHSAERKTLYDGTVTLDAAGTATVILPSYVSVLNSALCYQLTPIGAAAPSLHISQELAGDRFAIAGGAPGQKVCWMVTGVRKDRYAVDHPFRVEVQAIGAALTARSERVRKSRAARAAAILGTTPQKLDDDQ
ncbi:hypothetical protein ACFY19_00445 [Streptosporangium saharense]|uniref:hypothetical protein n=1 Tax=Streptosporangium saharense TaxID=1706840 RepID=UPI0036CE1DCD